MNKAPHIYLDHNATTPVLPAAIAAANDVMAHVGNPSSVHAPGRHARAVLENARESVAKLVGVAPGEVVFTSGGTEANALVLLGAAAAGRLGRLIISAIEHDSVLESAKLAAQRFGVALDVVPVLPSGVIDLEALERLLSSAVMPAQAGIRSSVLASRFRGNDDEGTLVSVMAANNETGVLQPIDEIAALAHRHGALFHTDAAQIISKLPFEARDCDFITVVAHKIGGVTGAGALINRRGIALAPLWGGGKQESARRSGTEALPAIAALGAAAAEAGKSLALRAERAAWRDQMEAYLKEAVPGIKVFGAESPRLPQTSYIGLPGTLAETQVIALDLAGFAVSAGSACSSGKVHQSHVLTAMGMSEAEARCAIRVSFGWSTEEADLHRFTEVWAAQLQRSSALARHPVRTAARSDAVLTRDPDLVDPGSAKQHSMLHRVRDDKTTSEAR